MFETATLNYGPPTKRVWATLAGFAGQVLLIGCALAAPIIWPRAIPHMTAVIYLAPPGPPPGPPPGDPPPKTESRPKATRPFSGVPVAPAHVPDKILVIDDAPEIAGPPSTSTDRGNWIVGSLPGPGGSGNNLAARIADNVPPPIKPPAPQSVAAIEKPVIAAPPKRISAVELARPIHRVEPIYPPLAIAARIQGTVRLIGVLGADGRIRELQVVSGPPMLARAAMDAVKQWVYAPTLLNGQPVEVQAPIDVNFILNR
jgi:protein TonB